MSQKLHKRFPYRRIPKHLVVMAKKDSVEDPNLVQIVNWWGKKQLSTDEAFVLLVMRAGLDVKAVLRMLLRT